MKRRRRSKRWIQGAVSGHRGALHRQLGVPAGEDIPVETLRWAAKQPGKMGRRARLALNLRGLHHHH